MPMPQVPWRDSLASLFSEAPLYLITDGYRLRQAGKLAATIEALLTAVPGFIGAVQLREQTSQEHGASDEELLRLGETVRKVCSDHGARLLINRNIRVASSIGADGVHLGKSELPRIFDLQKQFGLIGYSSHSIEEIPEVAKAGASFVTLSPIYQPCSKPDHRTPLGLETLTVAKEISPIPVVALGGISATNVAHCKAAGADGIACIGAILNQEDPVNALQSFAERWK